MSLHDVRQFYARLVTAKGGSSDERLIRAFAKVDRAAFAGSGPWKILTPNGYVDTPNADPGFVYQNEVIALKPELSINNGEPALHARCLAAAAPKAGETVIHVGAGCGYYTALLAELVTPSGRVEAYEVEADLADQAQRLLAGYSQVSVHVRSALGGALPPADVIYVNAGVSAPPLSLLDAVRPGGRMVFPLTAGMGPGVMLLLTRTTDDVFASQIVSPAMFIPCVGGQDAAQAQALMQALGTGGHRFVRSLRRSGDPDETAWLAGEGWWFSTRDS